ncbi:MAG: hypothetical protein KKA16_15115 [Alphaproteobacteria bacterium]|nr:hypothetical protein [Alphaproteobacteria bacterium]MBU2380071.1 hypothetical protein [Alphaproteobacteria bacterium]
MNLQVALGATLRALPRLWSGAVGALALCLAAWLAPVIVPMTGALWTTIWILVTGLATLVAVGALTRLAVTDDVAGARTLGLGPLGLQFGRPEARLLGAAALCLIFLAMILIVLSLVVLAIFGTAELDVAAIQARDWSRVGAPWKLGLLTALGLGALLVPLLLIVRLALFAPATLGRRQMVSLNSMGIAYGSFWPLLAGLIVTALPKIVLLVLIGGGVISGLTASLAWTVGLIGLQFPLTLGFLGAAYRQLEYWTPEETKP